MRALIIRGERTLLALYIDWLDWGIGLSIDWRMRCMTIDLGPLDVEIDFDV